MESHGKARILLVEDEPISALEMQETLEGFGYEVLPVLASGDEVLGAVLARRPDLIIMDIHLKSYIDGVDAVSRLRMVSKVPVIYVTAYTGESVENRALGTGPVDYLEKPVEEARLRASVEKALAGA